MTTIIVRIPTIIETEEIVLGTVHKAIIVRGIPTVVEILTVVLLEATTVIILTIENETRHTVEANLALILEHTALVTLRITEVVVHRITGKVDLDTSVDQNRETDIIDLTHAVELKIMKAE